MRKIFSPYPSLFFSLLGLLFIQQLIFYLFHQSLQIFIYDSLQNEIGFFIQKNYVGIKNMTIGICWLIGGWWSIRITDIRKGMLTAIALIMLGHLMIYLGGLPLLFGAFTALLGAALFSILIIIHLNVFFPLANELKDRGFLIMAVLILFPPVFISQLYYPVVYFFGEESSYLPGLIILYGGLVFTIYRSKNIGFQLESTVGEEKQEASQEEERASSFKKVDGVLVFLIAIFVVFELACNYIPSLGVANDFFITDIHLYISLFYLVLLLLGPGLLLYALVFFSLRNETAYAQLDKFKWGIFLLFAFAFAELGLNQLTYSWELNHLLEIFINYLPFLLFFPPLLSIFTHVKIDARIGLWVGMLWGLPDLILSFLQLVLSDLSQQYLPYLSVVLLIPAYIYLRDNRNYILQTLALNEANQEEEEEEDDFEIGDHLVENDLL